MNPERLISSVRTTSASITIPGTNEVLTYTSGGTVVVPLHDGLGTPIGLVNSAGILATRYIYNPFGGFQTQGPSSSSYPFRMGGIEYDSDTGLYHAQARYYSPTLQRFLSGDPIGYGGGTVNFFAYAGNNPVNSSDPSGMDAEGEQGVNVGIGISFGIGGINPDTLYIRHDARFQLLFSQRQEGVYVPKGTMLDIPKTPVVKPGNGSGGGSQELRKEKPAQGSMSFGECEATFLAFTAPAAVGCGVFAISCAGGMLPACALAFGACGVELEGLAGCYSQANGGKFPSLTEAPPGDLSLPAPRTPVDPWSEEAPW